MIAFAYISLFRVVRKQIYRLIWIKLADGGDENVNKWELKCMSSFEPTHFFDLAARFVAFCIFYYFENTFLHILFYNFIMFLSIHRFCRFTLDQQFNSLTGKNECELDLWGL